MTDSKQKFSVLIVGGGAAGITVAAILRKRAPQLSVAIVEPSAHHCYQPAWTLVGAGQFPLAQTRRATASVIPSGVQWIQQKARSFAPDTNSVELADGSHLHYEQLVVAAGLQINWDAVEGLVQTLGKNGVCSNYSFETAAYTWECIEQLGSGNALFTQPPMPIKCPGAPQKILYMAADRFRRRGEPVRTEFFTAGPSIFGVPFYAKALMEVVKDYGIATNFGHKLVAVNGNTRTATFEFSADDTVQRKDVRFDMLHVTPPQSAPDFIRNSALADAAGFVAVDKHSLQHPAHANVFALGDCAGTANSKTAAAVRSQAPLLVQNLLAQRSGKALTGKYDGYASCPLTTSIGKIMLAEFGYDGVPMPSFAADPRQPRRSYWHLKRRVLPWLYWNLMLKGDTRPDLHAIRQYPDALPTIQP
jgi:sulfide:quinone oxidoreductase